MRAKSPGLSGVFLVSVRMIRDRQVDFGTERGREREGDGDGDGEGEGGEGRGEYLEVGRRAGWICHDCAVAAKGIYYGVYGVEEGTSVSHREGTLPDSLPPLPSHLPRG
jgi:hypothetical protein